MRIDGIGQIGEMEAPKVQYSEPVKYAAEEHIKTQKNAVAEEQISDEKIDEMLKKVNGNVDIKSNGIKFEKDLDTEKWVVKVFNEKTGELIRQIPNKEFMEMAKNIEKTMGSIFNKEV